MPFIELSQKKNMLKPWITQGIRESIAVRNKLWKKSFKLKSDKIHKLYKTYRNMITHLKKYPTTIIIRRNYSKILETKGKNGKL